MYNQMECPLLLTGVGISLSAILVPRLQNSQLRGEQGTQKELLQQTQGACILIRAADRLITKILEPAILAGFF